jgi:phage I-like protein
VPADIVRASFSAFDGVDAPDKVPSEIRLFRAGKNEYADGELLFDADAAQSVMAIYQKRGLKLKADYEHQSLSVPPVIAPASAKRWTPEVRNGELWATDIQWTKKARQMIADGEYDYFSIAARVEQKSGRVVEMINFALTNTPAANNIEPLIAASLISQTENRMKTVIVALGLKADAEEADALAAVSSLKDLEREVIALSGKSDRASALGAIRAMQQSHEQVVALNTKVAQLESDKRAGEFDALVKQGQDANQITKAMADGEWLKSLRGKEDGVVQLRSFLASAPKLASKPGDVVEASKPEADEEITPLDYQMARRFCGDDEQAITKRLEALKELRRNERKVAALSR